MALDLVEPAQGGRVKLVQFGVADDGTPLHWAFKEPDRIKFPPPWYCVLAVHGGGFTDGSPGTPIANTGADLTAAGFIVFSPEYRLAPPGKIAGQKSDGRYPNQTDDVALALEAAKKDKRRVKGIPQMVGGSGGGYQAQWFAAKGLVLSAVSLSGASSLDDPESREASPYFASKADNYAPNNLGAASPITYVTANSKPMMLVTFATDAMPPQQSLLMTERLAAYDVSTIFVTLPGSGHSWGAWDTVKAQAIDFLQEHKA